MNRTTRRTRGKGEDPTATVTVNRSAEAAAIPEQAAAEIGAYSKSLQSKPIHGLISSSTSKQNNIEINAITHTGTMISDGVVIIIDEEAINDIIPQTLKVFVMLLQELTAQLPQGGETTADLIQKGRVVKLQLSTYMDRCGISDIKTARAQLNAAIRALYAVSLEWNEDTYEKPTGKKRAVKVTKHHRMRITDHTITEEEGNPVKRGAAEIRFSFDLAEYLSGAYIMPFPDAIYLINTHLNPYSIPFTWKLCTLYNMNYGKPTQFTTTVETMLRAAKGIPRYSSIAHTGQIYDRIIKPMDRDLSALLNTYGILSALWYYNSDGEKIPAEQLGSLSYAEFSKLNIHFELKNYPDQTPRLEAQRKHLTGAISRTRTTSKKKPKATAAHGDGAQE